MFVTDDSLVKKTKEGKQLMRARSKFQRRLTAVASVLKVPEKAHQPTGQVFDFMQGSPANFKALSAIEKGHVVEHNY